MKTQGSAVWEGGIRDGAGVISTRSGALNRSAYSFMSRFGGQAGANPEELIAAAHAACFAMDFARRLGSAGFRPERIETSAEITMEQDDGVFAIKSSHLTLNARVPRADPVRVGEIVSQASGDCPVSKLLKCVITVDANVQG